MGEQYINSMHIEKLGHKIQEIRERALQNIISKLDNGVLFDNDLARSKELLNNLLKWFLYDPCSKEELVFSLLKRILQSESGQTLIEHIGKESVISNLEQIHLYLDPKYLTLLEDILEVVNGYEPQNVVPPLQSDVPLSYRSTDENDSSPCLGTTATLFQGSLQKDASVEQQTGAAKFSKSTVSTAVEDASTYRIQDNLMGIDNLLDHYFEWQPLIEADRHVLYSVEKSLINPVQPAMLLHSCEFFRDVLLHDFSAEVFLQRPKIIMEFFSMLNCGSTRITNAILSCFCDLTVELQTRINHCNDASLRNMKLKNITELMSFPSTPLSGTNQDSDNENCFSDVREKFEKDEDVIILKQNQIPTLKYCYLCITAVFKYLCVKQNLVTDNKKNINQMAINLCLILLEKILGLISLCLEKEKNENQAQSIKSSNISNLINEIFLSYGLALEHFRIESVSSDNNLKYRAIYLYLLHNCVNVMQKLVPFFKCVTLLPRNLKTELSNSLLDVTFSRLYPAVHNHILNYVENFSVNGDQDHLRKYKEVKKICQGMTSTVKFLRDHKELTATENFRLASEALASLEFHKDFDFLKLFIDICVEKYPRICDDPNNTALVEEITLCLLNHSMLDIRQEMYRLCHKTVTSYIGPKLNDNTGVIGSQIQFLLSSKILTEIACYGLDSESCKIQIYAEDILTYILKCKIIVSEIIWNKIIQALIPALPIIACQISNRKLLSKTVTTLVDPDVAKESLLPTIAMLKCNIEFLFLDDPCLKEEAFSRICWMLSSQENARDFLPGFNTLYDTSVGSLSKIKNVLDLNKIRRTDHFYQPSSLHQVLEVLNSVNIEPVIKRSALNQISVMMEDPLLHQIFLDAGGIGLVVDVMKSALTEKNFSDYPDAIIPVISILKNICLYHGQIREELSRNVDVFYFTLRDKIIDDKWCLTSIRIQWNAEIFGGFDQLVKWEEIIYEDHSDVYNFVDFLKLTKYELKCIKNSSIDYCISHFLKNIQNATSHSLVLESIDLLTLYLYLQKLAVQFDGETYNNEKYLNHHLEKTFIKFLNVLPSCEDDIILLKRVIQLLCVLISYYETVTECWISSFLKDGSHCILDLLSVDDTTDKEIKDVAQELLKLITACVRLEQHYIDYYPPQKSNSKQTWARVAGIIAYNLKTSGKQHFYNLAYLDSLLSCLVHLTATLGWSESKVGSIPKDPLPQLIQNLCELVKAFHSGKGPSASVSVMGLSITRNVLLALNHILAELQNYKIKGWETCFFDEMETSNPLHSFIALWASRDIVLRAASLQLFAGLSLSPRAAIEIVQELKSENSSIWDLALRVLIDHTEASAVRENAAELLSNLASHCTPMGIDKTNSINVPLKKSSTMELFNTIDQFDFYTSLELIFNELYILSVPYRRYKNMATITFTNYPESEQSWNTSSDENFGNLSVSTPSLVKTVGNFLYHLLWLNPDSVSQQMQDLSLVKLFFRAVCNPAMSITNTRELSLYCDIIDMDATICLVLQRLACINQACRGTILYTRDCLNILISLLNPRGYHMSLPQLIYLRNRLWTSIFNLLSTLIECNGELGANINEKSIEIVNILCLSLAELGESFFIEAICESISNLGSNDLQNSALNFLICILRVEAHRFFSFSTSTTSKTVTRLLDTTKTTRSVLMLNTKTTSSIPKSTKKSLENHKANILEEIYFGKVFVKSEDDTSDDIEISIVENADNGLTAGVEICKILLFLYDLANLKESTAYCKKWGLVAKTLSSLLSVSKEAKIYALEKRLVQTIMKQFRDIHIQLSLESVECLRRVSDKKRLCPVLKEVDDLVCLMTNFMVDDDRVKAEAATMNLSDVLHKLWLWFLVQPGFDLLLNALKLLCTYTTGCDLACQTLPLTSPIAGSGPRKSPGVGSLLHVLITLINKQMEQISKTHDLRILEICFNILHNSCQSLECRVLITKSNLFQSISRLHPAITKKQKPWESIELLWLDFIQTFTSYPEGQASIAKISDVLDLILTLSNSSRMKNKLMALLVLRNISFYQSNKARLLSSADFLNVLLTKVSSGTDEEKNIAVIIIWALAANSQKAKIILKGIHLDDKLQNMLKHHQLVKNADGHLKTEAVERISYVLGILRDNSSDKIR